MPTSKKTTTKKTNQKTTPPTYPHYAFDILVDPRTHACTFVMIKYDLNTRKAEVHATGEMTDKKVGRIFDQKKKALATLLKVD